MAYSSELAGLQGLRLWSVVIAVLLGLYANWKYREGESDEAIPALGAAIFSLLIAWGTDYYKGVFIAGGLFVLAIVMYVTVRDEGPLPKLLLYTGGALLVSAILLYIAPITVFNEPIAGFMVAVLLLSAVVFFDTHLDRYDELWQVIVIFAIPVIVAYLIISAVGVDHAWYGLVMMYFAVTLALFGVYTLLIDPIYFSGALIFLDDYIGHGTVDTHPDGNIYLIWTLLFLIVICAYIYVRWKE